MKFTMTITSETDEWCEVCCSWIRDGRHRRDCPLLAEADGPELGCASRSASCNIVGCNGAMQEQDESVELQQTR